MCVIMQHVDIIYDMTSYNIYVCPLTVCHTSKDFTGGITNILPKP